MFNHTVMLLHITMVDCIFRLLIAFYFCFQMTVVINSLLAYLQCEKKCEWKAELPRYKRVKHDEGKKIVALHLNHCEIVKCEKM